jgi:hypothetical protein
MPVLYVEENWQRPGKPSWQSVMTGNSMCGGHDATVDQMETLLSNNLLVVVSVTREKYRHRDKRLILGTPSFFIGSLAPRLQRRLGALTEEIP